MIIKGFTNEGYDLISSDTDFEDDETSYEKVVTVIIDDTADSRDAIRLLREITAQLEEENTKCIYQGDFAGVNPWK